MKRCSVIVWCVGAAVVGLASGYLLRETTRSESSGGENLAKVNRANAKSEPVARHRTTSYASKRMSRINRADGTHRWLEWMSAVENAALSDLPGLARMAKDDPGALRMIGQRWMELDCDHLCETLRTESRNSDEGVGEVGFPVRALANLLFDEWPKRDPEAAIAAVAGPDGIPGLSGFRHSVLNTVIQDNPARGLKLMSEWSIMHFGPDTSGLKKWAQRDPRAAAQAALEASVGYGAEYSMVAIAEVWATNDPEGALEFAQGEPGRLARTLQDTVFAQWAGRDRAGAAEWLAGQDDDALRAELSPLIVEAWAREDAQAALSWCEENLAGHRLVAAVVKLAKGAAAADAQAAAELVARMDPSPARTQAVVAVAESWFPQSWPTGAVVTSEAVDWLRGLNDPELQGAVLSKVAWGWAAHDPDGLMEMLGSPAASEAPLSAYSQLVQRLARDDARQALEWAAELPAERSQEVANRAFAAWLQHQPTEAQDWLMELSPSDPRCKPLLERFVSAIAWADVGTATRLLGRLSPEESARSRGIVERADIPDEKKRLLMKALEGR